MTRTRGDDKQRAGKFWVDLAGENENWHAEDRRDPRRNSVAPWKPEVPKEAVQLIGKKRCDQHHHETGSCQPAEPDTRSEQRRQADTAPRPQLPGLLVDGAVRPERKHVDHPEHPLTGSRSRS